MRLFVPSVTLKFIAPTHCIRHMITRGEKSQEKKPIPFERPEMGGFSEPCKLNGFRKTLINYEKLTDMASLHMAMAMRIIL